MSLKRKKIRGSIRGWSQKIGFLRAGWVSFCWRWHAGSFPLEWGLGEYNIIGWNSGLEMEYFCNMCDIHTNQATSNQNMVMNKLVNMSALWFVWQGLHKLGQLQQPCLETPMSEDMFPGKDLRKNTCFGAVWARRCLFHTLGKSSSFVDIVCLRL